MLGMEMSEVVRWVGWGMGVWVVGMEEGGEMKDWLGGVGNRFKVLVC